MAPSSYDIHIVFTDTNFLFDKDVIHTRPINVFLDYLVTENEVMFFVSNLQNWMGAPPLITLNLPISEQDELKLFKPEKHKELILSQALESIDKAYKTLLITHLELNKDQIVAKIRMIKGHVHSIKDMYRYISFKEIIGFPINQAVFYEVGRYLGFLKYNSDEFIHYSWLE